MNTTTKGPTNTHESESEGYMETLVIGTIWALEPYSRKFLKAGSLAFGRGDGDLKPGQRLAVPGGERSMLLRTDQDCSLGIRRCLPLGSQQRPHHPDHRQP